MKKIFLIFLFVLTSLSLFAQDKKVYHAKIEGDIDLGLAPFVRRVITEAEKNGASAIIFEINTFGGRVDAATQIKDAILNANVLTIAFINKRAISAGALISISCNKIAMATGGSIGASTVVDQEGKKVSEKYQSYMRGEMRATAEKNGRRTDIAEGMVDETIVVKGLDDSTKLITLTSEEALKWGFADTIAENLQEVLKAFELEGANIIHVESNWAENFVRFLNNPIISSMLIMIGLIGIYTEIKTPGFGFAGIIGLSSLALFFGTSFILQLATIIEIVIFIIGLILIIVEIFVIPGFGFLGIGGIILIVAALFLSLININFAFDLNLLWTAIIQLAVALAGSLLVIGSILKYLPKSTPFNKLILSDAITGKAGFNSSPDFNSLLGKEGVTLTQLRPTGIVVINNERFDVVTEGDFVEKNIKVKVIKIEGVRIVVREIQ